MKLRVIQALSEKEPVRTELCEDERGARVVVKTLSVAKTDEESLRLFEREADVLRALDHPRIPAYVDAWTEETGGDVELRLAQRYVEGRPLSSLLAAGERLDAERVRALGVEIAEVLAYLHALHPPVIHRDLKPSNLVLDDDGRVHLVDFGAVAAPRSTGETVVGTFGYMPPEQYEGRSSPASDVYALGMVLCTLVTHRQPWEHDEDPREALRGSGLPEDLKRAVLSLIERDPEARPQSGAEATARLRGSAPVAASVTRTDGMFGIRTALVAVVIVMIAAAGLFVGVFLSAVDSDGPPGETQKPPMVRAPKPDVVADVVHCASRFSRILAARDRYLAWAPAAGPTCAERHVQGTFAAYDDTELRCRDAAEAARGSWTGVVPLLDEMARTSASAILPLKRAARYYSGREFQDDDCARGIALHPDLDRIFRDATAQMNALTPLLDARLRTAAFAPAFEGPRGAAIHRYYGALGALAAEAPTSASATWSEGRLLDAWDRVKEAYDEVEAAPAPELPAAIGMWQGSTANAKAAYQSLLGAVRQLRRPAHKLPASWDPTGVRGVVYRALVVGLRTPVP